MQTFSNNDFIGLLEESDSASVNNGWRPIHQSTNNSTLISYIKDHSYGEYIFDWAWADLYNRMGLDYYPKLIHAIPYTPVNNSKFIGEFDQSLLEKSFKTYQEQAINSEHYLFTDNSYSSLEELGFFKQLSTQYHFKNEFESFDDFLSKLKKGRRKNIKKERQRVKEYPIEIITRRASGLRKEELSGIYGLYLTTIQKKNAYAYLKREFFLGLDKIESCYFNLAINENGNIIAMAMFFDSPSELYGRYWGIHPAFERQYELLHFEMCYYMGMEYTIHNKLKVFEAGAQGEQKLLRGFTPVEIESWHHLKNQELHHAIETHIEIQNSKVIENHAHLEQYLPYKR